MRFQIPQYPPEQLKPSFDKERGAADMTHCGFELSFRLILNIMAICMDQKLITSCMKIFLTLGNPMCFLSSYTFRLQ